jgi:hypothetical protein
MSSEYSLHQYFMGLDYWLEGAELRMLIPGDFLISKKHAEQPPCTPATTLMVTGILNQG